MNATPMITVVILALIFVGIIMAVIFTRRTKTDKLQAKFGSDEYAHEVEAQGSEHKAQAELKERVRHVEALGIHPLTVVERDRYLPEWQAVQSKFVDQPGQAIVDADRMIMEVMQLRAYPVADFEQRAADLSVNYPTLVSNYRAARLIALKNKAGKADTEEMRQAIIYYRSLFEELLETEEVVAVA